MFTSFLDEVRHALHRSRVRGAILIALLNLAGPATAAEIARLARANVRSVLGALVGDGHRYRVEDSLATLGLVRAFDRDGKRLYELTVPGVAAARAWRQETIARLNEAPRVRS